MTFPPRSPLAVIGLVALLAGCGSSSDEDAGAITDSGGSRDAGPMTDAGSDIDGGPMADGGPGSDAGPVADAGPGMDAGPGTDAGPGADAGTGTDGGLVACGSEPAGARRIPRSCEEPRCHGDRRCADLLLTSWGFPGYTECGSMSSFTAPSSTMVCGEPPIFGYFYPAGCGRIDYSGTIRLYCAPDRATVVAYFWGMASETTSPFVSFDHAGHYHESGPSGGSGGVSSGVLSADFMSVRFYGLQDVGVRATPTGFEPQTLTVWFHAQSLIDPSDFQTTGGFALTLTP